MFMGRTIKLLLLYFAYQLAFFGVFTGVYMLKNGIMETSDMYGSTYMSLVMWVQFLSTLAIGLHVVLGKYVSADVFRLRVPNKLAILFASAVFIVVMGLWTNYFSELAELPDNMKEMFDNLEHCKYHDCLHINEDGCYIIELVKQNKILKSRYENYIKFISR